MGWADRFRSWFASPAPAPPARFDERPPARFANPMYPVDQLNILKILRGTKIDRAQALSVPAVLRGRNLICSISTLPLELVDADNRIVDHPLFRQIDTNVPNVTTLAMTIEDLLFDAVSWWKVTAFSGDGYPAAAVRYSADQVRLQPPPGYQKGYLPSDLPTEGVVWIEGRAVSKRSVIRFDSPNPPLLVAGERAIRRAIALDEAADLYATNRRMRGFFSPADPNVDPAPDEEIEEMLDDWAEAREKRLDGYVPVAVKYNPIQDPTPAEVQIIAQQQRADLALANALGIDPEDLGLSTTSRTYQNGVDRRKDRINDVLSPYMDAITDRLSMPDVTKRGKTARFNLDDYLRADPKTRAEVQSTYAEMGVTDPAEIRKSEGLPPRAIAARPAGPRPPAATGSIPASQVSAMPDGLSLSASFEHADGLTFEAATDATFAVDVEARTITGLIVPWGKVGKSKGRRYRFAAGTIRWSAVNRVKLLRDHVNSSAIGKAIRLQMTDQGLVGTFKISPGRAGDEALALAADEVLDGLSMGVDMRPEDMKPDPQNPGAWLVFSSALREVSLTAVPSFDDSRLTSVQASRDGGSMHECEHCHAQLTPGVAHTCPQAPPTVTPATAATPAAPVQFTADQFAQFMTRLGPAEPAAADDGAGDAEPRPTVDPGHALPPGPAQVTEALPYRFSYQAGKHTFSADADHDFSTDLFTLLNSRASGPDREAAELRVNGLIRAAFADVERADVTDSTVPNRYRPDMWQPQQDYATPLWDFVNSGSTDGTKFDIPKFTSSSGLVGPATEKTEPAGGSYVAELQTITPTQVWGKVEITRQAYRAGGTPQLSGILWDQMLREYYEDRENAVATFLNTLTAATDITITGTPASSPDNDDDQTSANDLEMALAALQFVRGGNVFRAFAVHVDLYKMLARVKDDAGRPLYPMLNPMNANGTAAGLFRTLNIGGTTAVPAWALGATGTAAANSWLFDPAKVRGWASAPERMFWDFGATVQTANIPQLSFVTMGIYGDVALGNTDINGVRQVIFDPSV